MLSASSWWLVTQPTFKWTTSYWGLSSSVRSNTRPAKRSSNFSSSLERTLSLIINGRMPTPQKRPQPSKKSNVVSTMVWSMTCCMWKRTNSLKSCTTRNLRSATMPRWRINSWVWRSSPCRPCFPSSKPSSRKCSCRILLAPRLTNQCAKKWPACSSTSRARTLKTPVWKWWSKFTRNWWMSRFSCRASFSIRWCLCTQSRSSGCRSCSCSTGCARTTVRQKCTQLTTWRRTCCTALKRRFARKWRTAWSNSNRSSSWASTRREIKTNRLSNHKNNRTEISEFKQRPQRERQLAPRDWQGGASIRLTIQHNTYGGHLCWRNVGFVTVDDGVGSRV